MSRRWAKTVVSMFVATTALSLTTPAAAISGPKPPADCKSVGVSSPVHLYKYETTALGYQMTQLQGSLRHGECFKTFGKTIEGSFAYHDNYGVTAEGPSYWTYGTGDDYQYFYRVLTTSRKDFSEMERFVRDEELAHCPSARCDEAARPMTSP